MNKEEIIKIFGLPADASDDQITTALKAGAQAIEDIAAERTKAEASEQKLATANADCDAAKKEADDAKKELENCKNDLESAKTSLANEQANYRKLAELKTKSETVGLANEKIPETPEGKREMALALVNELQHTKGLSYNQAFAAVQQKNPDLFK